MAYKTFQNWMFHEGKDIFGFEKDKKDLSQVENPKDALPIIDVSTTRIVENLSNWRINHKNVIAEWGNQVQWGEGPGALMATFTPLGSFKTIIRKLNFDLEGNPTWICKGIIPLNYIRLRTEENIASLIHERVLDIDSQEIDSPSEEFPEFDKLIYKLASAVKRYAPDIFVFESVKQLDRWHRLIYMSLRGAGSGAPGGNRVNEFIIECNFKPKMGLLRIFGYDVQSPMKVHSWISQPSEFDEYFAPTQNETEIIDAIVSALRTY